MRVRPFFIKEAGRATHGHQETHEPLSPTIIMVLMALDTVFILIKLSIPVTKVEDFHMFMELRRAGYSRGPRAGRQGSEEPPTPAP